MPHEKINDKDQDHEILRSTILSMMMNMIKQNTTSKKKKTILTKNIKKSIKRVLNEINLTQLVQNLRIVVEENQILNQIKNKTFDSKRQWMMSSKCQLY